MQCHFCFTVVSNPIGKQFKSFCCLASLFMQTFQIPQGNSSNFEDVPDCSSMMYGFQIPQGNSSNSRILDSIASINMFQIPQGNSSNQMPLSSHEYLFFVSNPIGKQFKSDAPFFSRVFILCFKSHREIVQMMEMNIIS